MSTHTADGISVTISPNAAGAVDLVTADGRTLDRGRSWLTQWEAELLLELVPSYTNAELSALYRKARRGHVAGVRACPKR